MSTVALNNGFNFELGFATLAAKFRAWKSKHDTRVELNRLSERELEDIGICRADIDAIVDAL